MIDNTTSKKEDSTEIIIPHDSDSIYTVLNAQELYSSFPEEPTKILVEGYIVGCVRGPAISTAQFQGPFVSPSNLLIADRLDESDPQNCLPVCLPNQSELRVRLNLIEHSELLHRKILVCGYLETYFRQAGIKTIESYLLLGNNSNTPTDTTQTKPDSSGNVILPIDTAAVVIIVGRKI